MSAFPGLNDLVSILIGALFLGVALLGLHAIWTVRHDGTRPAGVENRRQPSPRREMLWTTLAAVLLLAVFVYAR